MDFSCLKNYNLLIFDRVDSTNDEAIRLAKAGASGSFIIFAKEQVSGKGQKGRIWQSLQDNLNLSIMIETKKNLNQLVLLSYLVGNVVADTIAKLVTNKENKIKLKWPNDVLIDDKKVAGILLESIKVGDKQFLVIGIGVNIKYSPLLEDKPADSLAHAIGYSGDAEEFMDHLIIKFDEAFFQWNQDENFAKIRTTWLARAYNLNKVITIDIGQRRISGLFRDIDDSGAIVVELASGEVCRLNYGELINSG